MLCHLCCWRPWFASVPSLSVTASAPLSPSPFFSYILLHLLLLCFGCARFKDLHTRLLALAASRRYSLAAPIVGSRSRRLSHPCPP